MVKVIAAPRRITATGSPPKQIKEYIGIEASGTSAVSIARMISPSGWSEPAQVPEFDEYTLVLKGNLQIETEEGIITIRAGEAAVVNRGERIRYSTPEGAEYIAICIPAFSQETVHREDSMKKISG